VSGDGWIKIHECLSVSCPVDRSPGVESESILPYRLFLGKRGEALL